MREQTSTINAAFGGWTVGDMADAIGVEYHRIAYILGTRRIEPAALAGGTRVFSDDQFKAVAAELKRMHVERPRKNRKASSAAVAVPAVRDAPQTMPEARVEFQAARIAFEPVRQAVFALKNDPDLPVPPVMREKADELADYRSAAAGLLNFEDALPPDRLAANTMVSSVDEARRLLSERTNARGEYAPSDAAEDYRQLQIKHVAAADNRTAAAEN